MAVHCPLLVTLTDKTCKEDKCEFWVTYSKAGEAKGKCGFKIMFNADMARFMPKD